MYNLDVLSRYVALTERGCSPSHADIALAAANSLQILVKDPASDAEDEDGGEEDDDGEGEVVGVCVCGDVDDPGVQAEGEREQNEEHGEPEEREEVALESTDVSGVARVEEEHDDDGGSDE